MISLFGRSRGTLGLDIGSGSIKAVAIDHSGDEPELVHVSHVPLLADAIVEGEVLDPPLVADAIRAALQGVETRGRTVVTAVGGRDVIVKKIQLDRIPEEEAREVIQWEAPQYVPFDMESVQLDFHILDPHADGLEMNVLLVAAKRELIEQKMLLLGEAGLTPDVIDVDAFALLNAFQYNYPEAGEGLVAIVNVGHELTTVNVLRDGIPVVTRDVPHGSRHLREDLQRRHGLSSEAADAVIHGSEVDDEYRDVFNERNDELVAGVERAVGYLSLELGAAERVGTAYVAGGGASRAMLIDTLAQRLGARVEVANPLQRLRARPDATAMIPLDQIAPSLMLPIGLGLRRVA